MSSSLVSQRPKYQVPATVIVNCGLRIGSRKGAGRGLSGGCGLREGSQRCSGMMVDGGSHVIR
jgi:hypothetical protein